MGIISSYYMDPKLSNQFKEMSQLFWTPHVWAKENLKNETHLLVCWFFYGKKTIPLREGTLMASGDESWFSSQANQRSSQALRTAGFFCSHSKLGGGFKHFFIFTPTWGNDSIWLIFFKGVETTNQKWIQLNFVFVWWLCGDDGGSAFL